MPDKNTNLPILDDIIKPGNADKAVHQPASKVQSSLQSDGDSNKPSTTSSDAETSALPATDDLPDSIEMLEDNQSAIDAIDQTQIPLVTETEVEPAMDEAVLDEFNTGASETRASATNSPDLDALTEEVLGNMMLDIEQLLREKIRQTLDRHFSGKTRSD